MTERNQCNSLGIDIQNTYDVFRASHDFLFGKTDDDLNGNLINGKDTWSYNLNYYIINIVTI